MSIKGGAEVDLLRRILAEVGDSGAYSLAEIAFGQNSAFGGTVRSPLHIDMVY